MKKRSYGLDLLKFFAAAMVIAVHHFNTIGFYNIKYTGGKTMYLATSIYIITLTCVPLFLISTGYLLQGRKIEKKHFTKILYFLIEVALIYLLGILVSLLMNDNFTLLNWVKIWIKSLLNPAYYIGLYFSIYLVSPFLNRFFISLSDKEKNLFMIVLIVCISLPIALNKVFHISFFDTRPSAIWSVMYYFVGLYIYHFQPHIKYKKLFLILILNSIIYGLIISHYRVGNTYEHVMGYYQNPFVLINAYLITVGLYKVQINNFILKKGISILSSMTLSFYILSGLYSDRLAMTFINLKGTLLFDMWTIIPKIFLSIIFSLPIGLIVYFAMRSFSNLFKKQKSIN
ncbi:acyltransferase family protein [Erysipelothrix rhusiopathiae]|uniref:acyltransferase n=1 Tax=Erysipelothrix rhusiopathiae TaxID=1648 RepID=UPI0023AF220E|nr:acyltransferase family protein [Erysipelothrix rhusiopathiae]MDE8119041.1 acyltransferase family protein [Erysipelothrix rhusiopathiae]MDE8133357.1 acyltransferase family protein [Erysipelothrix rhusiopathiae]MDE8147452.1 acyltransferase family protein [Erysipelothrix rhusiopathiae]MDE8163254.1 acyltransferase family protein [Erysipelothrix rhusiopathiae]